LFRKREGNWWVIPAWFLIGIVPAATARETPHALRIETTLPTFQIVTALGVIIFFSWIKTARMAKALRFTILFFTFSALLFDVFYYIHGFYTYYPRKYSGEWQYGYKESISFVKEIEHRYDRVVVTNALGRPYMYYLFYLKVDPKEYRRSAKIRRDPYGFVTVDGFNKYVFGQDLGKLRRGAKHALFISPPTGIPKKAKILKKFRLLDGSEILVAYQL